MNEISPGRLIVFEGISRSGKTTTILKLKELLEAEGSKVTLASWNSWPGLEETNKRIKHDRKFDATGLFLALVSDLWLTNINIVSPALEAGHIVLHDRYIYTSYVRAILRGVPKEMLDICHKSFIVPSGVIYIDLDPETAWERFFNTIGLGYDDYAYGIDIWPYLSKENAYKEYVKAQRDIYREIIPQNLLWSVSDLESNFKESLRSIF